MSKTITEHYAFTFNVYPVSDKQGENQSFISNKFVPKVSFGTITYSDPQDKPDLLEKEAHRLVKLLELSFREVFSSKEGALVILSGITKI
jgi:hypothetical protein